MSDLASRQAALLAAAALIGPAIPPAMVVNRPHEAVTALTRMADLLLPWLEGEPASPSTTSAEAPGTEAERVPQREEDNDGSNTGTSPQEK